MALIIEDGSNVANAQSFVTAAELVTYAALRGLAIAATEAEQESDLVLSMDYITGLESSLQGFRTASDQVLPFPRSGVVLNGYAVESDTIPQTLKNAQMECAIAANTQLLQINQEQNNVQSEKVDVLETSYFKGGSKTQIRLDRVMAYLSPYMEDSTKLVRV